MYYLAFAPTESWGVYYLTHEQNYKSGWVHVHACALGSIAVQFGSI